VGHPFAHSRASLKNGSGVSQVLDESRLFERSAGRHIPYIGHISPGVVLLNDRSVMAMVALEGSPYELESIAERNAKARRTAMLLRSIGDDNVGVYVHMVRHEKVAPRQPRNFMTAFAAGLDEALEQQLQGRLRKNDWFLTIIVRPRLRAKRSLNIWRGRKTGAAASASDRDLRQLEEIVEDVLATLADCAPRRLGYRHEGPIRYTEIGEALNLIRTCVYQKIPVVFGPMAASLYTERTVCRVNIIRFLMPERSRVGAIASFRSYPAIPFTDADGAEKTGTMPGMLNRLLSVDFDICVTNSFFFKNRAQTQAGLSRKTGQLSGASETESAQQEGLKEAKKDVAGNVNVRGFHHFSVAIYAAITTALDRQFAVVKDIIRAAGAVETREDFGAEAAHWSQLPGVVDWRTRIGGISSDNFAHLASLDGYPQGTPRGYWGAPVLRFRTRAGTPFDFRFHKEDRGHTMITGRNGSGKTALMGALAACLEPAMGANGIRILVDKDESNRLLIEACGGSYLHLRRGQASGLAPLRGWDDSTRTRAALHWLFKRLIMRDGRGDLDNEEDRRLVDGISAQMSLPSEARTMIGLRQFLGFAKGGAGDRFEKWCRGGSMGWLLDNDEHLVSIGPACPTRFFGFDFTELLPKTDDDDDGACEAAAAVITHQLGGFMDGRPITAFFEECRFYLEPLGKLIDDYSLTGRKKELLLVLVAQQPEHFLRSRIGSSLVSQCMNKIAFPDGALNHDDLRKLGMSQPAIEQLTGEMMLGNARRFLLWREGESVVLDFDLSALPDYLSVLSGRPRTLRAWDLAKEEHRGDVETAVVAFMHRQKELAR
jgi:type IV secretion system protein VirB4